MELFIYCRWTMERAELNDAGDLFLILDERYNQDVVTCYRLDNGAEIECIDDKCVAIVLPQFALRINRDIQQVELESLDFIDDVVHFNLDIGGQFINGRVNIASLNDKL